MTTTAAGVTARHLHNVSWYWFFLSVFTTRNGEKRKRINTETALPIWPSTATIYLNRKCYGRENNTFIKTCIKHAGSFASVCATMHFCGQMRFTCLLFLQTQSAYYLYGKPGNSGKNSNGTVHPSGNFTKYYLFPVFTETTEIFCTIGLDY